jgi:hypothetical protein
MTATAIVHPAGTARPALSGGWVVDMGDAFPTWTPNRERAYDVLDARAAAQTTRTLPSGEADARLAAAAGLGVCEALTVCGVRAGDSFRSP